MTLDITMDGQIPYPVEVEVGDCASSYQLKDSINIKMNEAQQLQQMQPLLYKQLKSLSMVVLLMLIFEGDTGTGKQNLAYGWRNMSFVRI